ncbi:MAG: methyltransferase domain-containing protein [Holosporales bacterium]|jgi:ubiquinone/menaquinone biosynthesis C-methylase UbiE|nr:methyltransferase domain-containing protein [Holosporales bacterium]
MEKLVERHWDYSKNAGFYKYRPNYSEKAIQMLKTYVGAPGAGGDFSVVDMGAGTGNLTILLTRSGLQKVTAVEPNDAMRGIGEEITKGASIQWIRATATETGLAHTYDWVTFGSSFNVIDRQEALRETHRLLKSGGFFSCLWNHRNLLCPIQKQAENIIETLIPNYTRGVRREDQRSFLEEFAVDFKDICYIEVDFDIQRTIDEYLFAWRSVKNRFWDLETPEGEATFSKITEKMRQALPSTFSIKYTTRAWTMQKK